MFTLGIESDKEILKYITYDLNDNNNTDLLNLLKPSIEEGSSKNQEEALEYLLKGIAGTISKANLKM